jgi:hypothetical protein
MELSDGSMLKVAVCTTCKPLLVSGSKVKETADRILRHHKIYWQQHETDDHGDGRPNKFDKLKVSDPGTNILKIRKKRIMELDDGRDEKIEQEKRNLEEREVYQKAEEARLEEIRLKDGKVKSKDKILEERPEN